jgi:hypothetical protein
MYPYVSTSIIEHRSLAADDESGLRASAPDNATPTCTITGTVRRQVDLTAVAGAHVIARDAQGRNAGATLSGTDGSFALRGLAGGDYALFATPLDAPVSAGNIGGARVIQTDFQPLDAVAVSVSAGGSAAAGQLLVGLDSPVSLGRNYDDFPLRAERGRSSSHVLHGAGFGSSASLVSSDPSVTLSNISWIGTTTVSFVVHVPANEPLGHVDLELRNGGFSVLAGAIEITPPEPTLTAVTPAQGALAGGTALVLTGSGFRAGAAVVIGGELYLDGAVGGCTVVDDSTLTLVTRASVTSGPCDVVVIDPSGVEGRASAGFAFVDAPQIDGVFPSAGSDMGGTVVKLRGAGLVAPLTVRIDGVVQRDVELLSSGLLRFVTEPGFAGGPAVLEVEDGDGDVASAAFVYVPQADPIIASLSPSSGPSAGGTAFTLHGASLPADAVILFGADPDTGLGGTPAVGVTWVDAQTLLAVSPSGPAGDATITVQDASTGQATVLTAGFTFQVSGGGSSGGGGGGGGCGSVVGAPPMDWGQRLAAAGWIPALMVVLALAQARRRNANA